MTRRRVGLIGDTHVPEAGPNLPAAAYDALQGCERILHCGDLHTIDVVDWLEQIAPTVVSRGNGDKLTPRVRRPGVAEDPRVLDNVVIEVEGFRIGLTHDLAHTEGRAHEEVTRLLEKRFGEPVDIAVYGHTHVPAVWGLDNGRALVNPGSPTMPYGYLGVLGTIGFIDIDSSGFEVTVVDLCTGEAQLHLVGPAPHPFEAGPRPAGGH